MALNASSHNTPGQQTGADSAPPPPIARDAKADILQAAKTDPMGHSEPGRDGGERNLEGKQMTEKELAKERAKQDKLRKFQEKQAKNQQKQQAASGGSDAKPKKEKKKETKDEPGSSADYVEETKKGDKKILKSLDDAYRKAYIPGVVESAWYDWWEKEGYLKPEFTADNKLKPKGSFVISIPPPNVTGALHAGHALATSLQDTLIRWHRMRGFTVLYLPGCDHAGISTQNVVENMLWRRQHKTRHDLGRPKFIETVQDWKEEYHQKITRVLKRLGASLDWSREAFTMDPNLSAAVTETFVRMHEEGLIYRSNRLVNWCGKLSTALSNLEVSNKEIEGRTMLDVPGYEKKIEFGVLTHFKYPIEGSEETIEVATTRPETMLGDTGIAVNPTDERYKHLVGKRAVHPFIEGRFLPIVEDNYVDKDFGTGAVKLTPAHDQNDFKLGTDHKLEFINILTDDGLLNENAGSFAGQKRFEARYTVVAELEKKGLFVKKVNNAMKIPLCEKSKDVIEPMLKPQWWMKMESLAKPAIEVVRSGEIKIRPESAEKNYYRWMESLNDWCLSRQLWWGHQIPAYKVILEDANATDEAPWVVGRTEDEARKKAEAQFSGKNFTLERDPDVLDTWFSSGLWPFSTLGWPRETHDLQHLYPTSVLETGWDILFFWVARMIIFGLKLTGKVPFTEVYCHSLVRDSEGRKMSKSLGNVIDPVDIMQGISLEDLHQKLYLGNLDPKEVKNAEKYQKTAFPQGIPECGADALRFSLVQYTTGGGDIAFDVKVMQAYRRFCNKIYQATKYVLGKLDSDYVPPGTRGKTGKESLAEKWILHKFTTASRDINKALEDREFSLSTQIAYRYWYDQLCDVYIENSKSIIQDGTPEERQSAINTLYTTLSGALEMIHPFMPFLTEELWQRLPRRPNDSTPTILRAQYPEYDASLEDPASASAYELVLDCSKAIRSLLAEYAIKDEGIAYVQPLDATSHETASAQLSAIKTLAGKSLGKLEVLATDAPKPAGCAVYPVGSEASIYVYVKDRIDIDKEIEKAKSKLKKASDGVVKQQKIVDGVLGSASAAVQEVEQDKLKDLQAEAKALEEGIAQFHKLKLEG